MEQNKDLRAAGETPGETPDAAAEDRRAFLSSAGKFALLVPPAMTFLLSTTLASDAIARSGRCSGSDGRGGGHGDCDEDDDDHGDHDEDDEDEDEDEDDYRGNNANTHHR